MNRRRAGAGSMRSSLGASGLVGCWSLIGAVFGLSACGSAPEAPEEAIESTQEALSLRPDTNVPMDGSCGFTVTSKYFSRRNGNGYIGELELKNVSAPRAHEFEVFADLGGAEIRRRCLFADCDPVEGGYS